MNVKRMSSNYTCKPLPNPRSRSTLRLQLLMDQQQKIEVSARLRDLRNNSAETNRSIADAAGVGERSVANWMSGDTGLKYENAKAVAALFDVDVNWLWSGQPAREQSPTPDPFAASQPPEGDTAQEVLREVRATQLEQGARLLRIERLLEDQHKQRQPVVRRRKEKG